jgi:membrane protease YdiL (CAAX protease family)
VIESRDPDPARRAWGPGQVAAGVLALLLTTTFEAGIVAAFDPNLDSLAAKLVLQGMLAVTLVAIAFIVTSRPGVGVASAGALGLRAPRGGAFWTAAAAYGLYVGFALAWAPLVHPHQEDVTRDLGFGDGTFGAVAAGVLIIAAAPISEEIFFRGFMFGGLRNRMRFAFAAPISAAVFGAFHFTGVDSLGILLPLAVLGFALAWVYERTGSIWPAVAIHALNNALAFVILNA